MTDKMTQFAIISPSPYLDELSTRSKYHLALAHLVEKDSVYATFYKQRSDAGDYVVMDNSGFEFKGQTFDPTRLIELGERCGAKCLVLPDYPFENYEKTIAGAADNIESFVQAGFDTMYVPQSEKDDLSGFMKSYEWAIENKLINWIGMSILALPNAVSYIHPAYARIVVSELLIAHGLMQRAKDVGIYHHYLGLINASLELPTLLRMGVLDTCDSSNPVWAAANGYQYDLNGDSYLTVTKKKLPEVDFNWEAPASLRKTFIDTAHKNLDIIQDIFDNPESHR